MATMPELTADLAAEQAALDAVVAGLDEAGWDTDTPARGWVVRDAISHLAYIDDKAVLAVTDPDAFAADVVVAARDIPGYMQVHVDRGRAMSGAEVLDWWRTSRARCLDVLAPLDPGHRIGWYGPSMSAIAFLRARLMETWAHGTDVTDGLGHPPVVSDRLRHVAHLGVVTRGFSYALRGRDVPPGEVRVELTGPHGDVWTWGPEDTTELVEGPALDFCRLVTQRRHLDDTRLITVGASAAEWLTIAQAFAGGPTDGRDPLG